MSRKSLESLDIKSLKREIQRRARRSQSIVRRLTVKRDRLLIRLRELEHELAEHGSVRMRPSNESNLADALAKLLARTTMSVTRIVEEVQKAGYRTTSPNFRTIVNQALIKDKRFKRVSRGKYTVR
jgi:hypothetical protein